MGTEGNLILLQRGERALPHVKINRKRSAELGALGKRACPLTHFYSVPVQSELDSGPKRPGSLSTAGGGAGHLNPNQSSEREPQSLEPGRMGSNNQPISHSYYLLIT